ncbi:MAG: putative Ig domain-containing protein [Gammaproteobacteria bacterium]|nr:putative Ig domain-containing protein [Gammaproteobacteria bacterium]
MIANTGGTPQANGCTATGLPTGLKAEVSGNACAVTGTPTDATDGEVAVTVTAVNTAGNSAVTFMLTVLATSPSVPSLAALGTRALTVNTAIEEIVFANASAAPQAGGCTARGLPAGLVVSLSSDNTSCRITGMPTTPTDGTVMVTVVATNADGSSEATVLLIVLNGQSPLISPAQRSTFTIDVEITDANAVILSSARTQLGLTTCRFVSENQNLTTLDGLIITTTISNGAGAGCRIAGQLFPVTNVNATERTYIVRVQAANTGVFHFSAFTVDVIVPEPSASPRLPDAPVPAVVPLVPAPASAVSVRNGFGGADINECFFIDDSNAQLPTLDGLTIKQSPDGRACLITGTLVGSSAKTFTVRALSASGQDEATVTYTFAADLTPVLAADPPISGIRGILRGVQIEPVVIRNTNPNPAAALDPLSCRLLGLDGEILIRTGGMTTVQGLILRSGTPDNTCILSGAPTEHGRVPIRVRADNGLNNEFMSNVVLLDFRVRLVADLSFAQKSVSRKLGSDSFTILPEAQNATFNMFDPDTIMYTWSSSDESVATVSDAGVVTLLARGNTVITANYAENILFAAEAVSYNLEALPAPPNLPDSPVTGLAVDGQVLVSALSVPNADDGADIAGCFFLDGTMQLTTLGMLNIIVATDKRSCTISGTLTGAGVKSFTVRATSASSQDSATVDITVVASTLVALTTTATEIDASLNTAIETVSLRNINTASAVTLVAGNCVLVNDTGAIVSSALVNGDEYTVSGLTLATDTTNNACTVTGAPSTAGRTILRVRADNATGSGNIVVLTVIARNIDMPEFANNPVNKRFGDSPFTNAITAASTPASFTWTTSDMDIATVDTAGEVTITGVGSAVITATRSLSDMFEAATATYALMVAAFPPDLPNSPLAVDAFDEIAITDLSVPNANEGADITECFFINDTMQEVNRLIGLRIAVGSGGRACLITGTLRGVGSRTFNVIARSGGGEDEVMVIFAVAPKPLASIDQFDVDGTSSCAVSSDGEIYCWGRGTNRPIRPSTAPNWTLISAASAHTCAINFGNQLYCWGDNEFRRLGTFSPENRTSPTLVNESTNWIQVSAGSFHTCAVNSSSELYCWGQGLNAKLGLGDNYDRARPTQVGSTANWRQASAGEQHTCAINSSSELYCWGSGVNGKVGLGNNSTQVSPAQVGIATNWTQVSVSQSHSCAVNSADELYCWGSGDNGRLGLSIDTNNRTAPTQVASATSWSQVSAGSAHTCAVAAADTLYCWGEGDNGRLGQGTDTADKNIPTQVGTDTDWAMVSAGEAHTCASKTDNQLFCWGKGTSGQLGLGNNNDSSSPARVTTAPSESLLP